MNKTLSSVIFCVILVSGAILPAFAESIVPPTRAFERATTSNQTVTALNYSSPINFKGLGGIVIKGSQGQQMIFIDGSGIAGATSKFGTYNATKANNVKINLGGNATNFINGTGNPIHVVNDPTRNQVNVTISSSGTSGVNSLNFTTNNDFDFNILPRNMTFIKLIGQVFNFYLKPNILTTNESAQTVTKQLTLNNLVLGGDANVGSNALTNSGHKSTLPTTSGILCQTNQTTACGTNSGVKSLNVIGSATVNQTTGNILLTTKTYQNNTGSNLGSHGVGPYSSMSGSVLQFLSLVSANSNCSISSNTTNVILTCSQNTGTITTGANIGVGTGSKGPFSSVTGTTMKFKNMTAGPGINISANTTDIRVNNTGVISVTGTTNNVTSSGGTTPVINLGSNVVMTNGVAQTFTKNLSFGATQDFFSNFGIVIDNTAGSFAYTLKGNAITGNTTINLGTPIDTVSTSYQPVYNFTSKGNVTGTNVAGLVMSGAYATLTPRYSTNASVTVTGYAYNSVATDGCVMRLYTSNVFMGANNKVLLGTSTAVGGDLRVVSATAQANETFAKSVVVTGMTLGQKNYFDLAFGRTVGGYCKLLNIDWNVREQ